jgi:hypothetical protein
MQSKIERGSLHIVAWRAPGLLVLNTVYSTEAGRKIRHSFPTHYFISIGNHTNITSNQDIAVSTFRLTQQTSLR